MNQQVSNKHKLQWKWVGITLLFYLVLYFLPILVTAKLLHGAAPIRTIIIGTWAFAGIIIVAAVAGYLSKGVTIMEPALASISMIILWIITFVLFVPGGTFDIRRDTMPTVIIMITVFTLSLFGAWLGERAQKLWKKPESQAA